MVGLRWYTCRVTDWRALSTGTLALHNMSKYYTGVFLVLGMLDEIPAM